MAIPSAKGVTISAALIPQLRQALEDAQCLAVAYGILNVQAQGHSLGHLLQDEAGRGRRAVCNARLSLLSQKLSWQE